MKPILLKIKGLNSFIEEQLIDFSLLTENGLFGIFGPTGSGKSTVLDAITLALYGRVPRSGGKPSGIVNSQSDKVQVIYEFAVGEGQNRQRYSVQRIFKRTGLDGARAELATIHDISNPDDPRPLYEGSREVNAGIIEIIGLSADDFTRSVVLPQGSFSEFLQLSGSDRRNMLERIFGMEKYGDRITLMIRSYKGKKHNERTHLEGLLSSFQDVSSEAYTSLNEECRKFKNQKEVLAESWQELEKEYQKYSAVWAWQQEIQRYQDIETELNQEKESWATREILLHQAEQAAVLKPLIDKAQAQQEELQEKKQNLALIEKEEESLSCCLQMTRQRWEEAARKKESQLPQLLAQKSNLELAGKIIGQIKELEDERDLLREEYKKITTALHQGEATLKNTQEKTEQIRLILGGQKERIAALKLSPEYREQVNEGSELEKECTVLRQSQLELEAKMASLETDLQKNETRLALIGEQRVIQEKLCQERLRKRKILIDLCPGHNEDLLAKQNSLNEMENELKSLLQWSQSLEKVENERHESQNQMLSLEKQLIHRKKILADSIEQRDGLIASLDKQRNHHMAAALARDLKNGEACLVCGSLHHPAVASDLSNGSTEALTEELDAAVQKTHEQEKTMHDLDMQYRYLVKEIERQNCELEKLSEQVAGRDIVSWQEKCVILKWELEDLKKGIAHWEAETRDNESGLANEQELLGNLKNQEASQTVALQKDRQSWQNLQGEWEAIKERLQESQSKYDTFRDLLGLNQIEGRLREIRENDLEMEALEQENKKLEDTLKESESQKSSFQEEVQGLKIKKNQYETIGSEKTIVIEQKSLEIKALCQDQEPVEGLKVVQAEMDQLQDHYAQVTDTYEQEKQQHEELSRLCSNLIIGNQTLGKILHDQEEELAGQLVARKFNNQQEVLSSFMTENEMKEERQAVREYREQVKLNAANLERVSTLLQGEWIEEASWRLIQLQREQIQEDLKEASNSLLLLEARQADMEKRVEELTVLQMQKREIDQQFGLLEELENLFKGKKFIDFIARTRLNYMAREASKTLRDISRGRYALELNPDGEFIMRDDFNGGARRPTHTLSGGETFLTSLALALALSSHIQLGKASLEFFFLDEGFGTLDAEVLDIVIGALEKLHSDKLSVGIISHVEELKYRIPRKLIVNPALPGVSGTTVSIEEN
ncbi:MAG: hypothetical protein CVU90_12895 [Firmicutes bacterium HGW-Firmicutes-15]|nr:MAG: hypothetical protein CVU90_12895 [Firmicutes bacterium HGW-Firmicutes-15]